MFGGARLGVRLALAVVCILLSACESVDTDTKVLAHNVMFENKTQSTLESATVQDALEEMSANLQETLVGAWTIENKNQGAEHAPTGAVTINADGTYDVTSGSFAAAGVGSDPMGCGHIENSQTYEFLTPTLAVFRHANGSPTNVNTSIPVPVETAPNRIVYLGSGACGSISTQRISILTREPTP